VFAEVIRGRFKDQPDGSAPYALPNAAKIGLPVLDQAHAVLLARLNAAHRALAAKDEAAARLQLEVLRSDLTTHFDLEEHIMQALGFRAMREDVRRHAASAAQLEDIFRKSLARGALLVEDLDRCFHLLIDEIMRGDVALKSHFQSMSSTRPLQQQGAP
jgi:hemerythrin